jgi:hypothetical protein
MLMCVQDEHTDLYICREVEKNKIKREERTEEIYMYI